MFFLGKEFKESSSVLDYKGVHKYTQNMAWIQAALLRKQISTNFQAYICAPRKGKNVFKCLKCHSEPFKPFLNISLVKHNSEMLSCIQIRALELVLSTNLSADYSLLGLLEANHKS